MEKQLKLTVKHTQNKRVAAVPGYPNVFPVYIEVTYNRVNTRFKSLFFSSLLTQACTDNQSAYCHYWGKKLDRDLLHYQVDPVKQYIRNERLFSKIASLEANLINDIVKSVDAFSSDRLGEVTSLYKFFARNILIDAVENFISISCDALERSYSLLTAKELRTWFQSSHPLLLIHALQETSFIKRTKLPAELSKDFDTLQSLITSLSKKWIDALIWVEHTPTPHIRPSREELGFEVEEALFIHYFPLYHFNDSSKTSFLTEIQRKTLAKYLMPPQ